jgi:hypothetical protein
MTVPLALPAVLAVIGAVTGGTAGAIVGLGLGVAVTGAVAAGAAVWSRQIGSLLEPEDAWAVAPRPPGYTAVVEWVYERTLRSRP